MSSNPAKTVRIARYVAVCGAAALSFGAIPAHADDSVTDAHPAKTVVRYSDLDLSKSADVHSLYARLQRASDRVCSDYKSVRDLRMKRLYDACYADSLARAVDSVGHSAVTAVFTADERIRLASQAAKSKVST